MERAVERPLRQGVRRQGVHLKRTFRGYVRQGHTHRARAQGQHEEQAHAHVGQNHATQKVRHRVHKPPAQGQGQPCALKAQGIAQLHHQLLLRTHGLLFFRQQATGFTG